MSRVHFMLQDVVNLRQVNASTFSSLVCHPRIKVFVLVFIEPVGGSVGTVGHVSVLHCVNFFQPGLHCTG